MLAEVSDHRPSIEKTCLGLFLNAPRSYLRAEVRVYYNSEVPFNHIRPSSSALPLRRRSAFMACDPDAAQDITLPPLSLRDLGELENVGYMTPLNRKLLIHKLNRPSEALR